MKNPQNRAPRHRLRARCYPSSLTLVFPLCNEEQMIPLLRRAVTAFAGELACPLEVLLVNDGSSDVTAELIDDWADEDPRAKVLHLARNFGHQSAVTAGLDHATGDAIVVLDADLQDPLPVIHSMIERYCEGYDVAYGQRTSREGEGAFKRATAWLFYRLIRALVHRDLPVDSGDFRLISRRFLAGLRQMRETHRYLRGMVAWAGYPQAAVPYDRLPRAAGETKYPLLKMLSFAWTAATSFSALPVRISFLFGSLTGLAALEEGVRALLAHIFLWYTVPGWSSLMVVGCGIGSMLLFSYGIQGEYIAKLYEQSKDRPLYLVADKVNVEYESGEVPHFSDSVDEI